jgi:hypothetical protein
MPNRIDDTVLMDLVVSAADAGGTAVEALGDPHDDDAPTWARITGLEIIASPRESEAESTDVADVTLTIAVQCKIAGTDGPAKISTLAMRIADLLDEQRLANDAKGTQIHMGRTARRYFEAVDPRGVRSATCVITVSGMASRIGSDRTNAE